MARITIVKNGQMLGYSSDWLQQLGMHLTSCTVHVQVQLLAPSEGSDDAADDFFHDAA